MSHIIIKGNVGNVRLGQYEKTQFLSFTVAENIGYFDKVSNDWVDKGTIWHDCTITVVNNPNRYAHLSSLITKGAPVLVSGRLTMSPQQKQNEQGEMVTYDNKYIQVENVGLTLDRIQAVTYKPKQEFGGANDPELQQRGQPSAQQQNTTPFDEPTPRDVMNHDSPF